MITYIKPTDIISIEAEDFKVNYSYKYYKKKKFLGINLRTQGAYYDFDSLVKEKALALPDDSILIGYRVYYKPNVKIRCKNHFFQKYFDTHTEAKQYAKDMADKYGLIPL